MKVKIRSFLPAVVWLVASTVAFCLPGETLPQQNWFAFIYLDKWIHVGLFAGMIALWCLPFFHRTTKLSLNSIFVYVAVASLSYGIAIEYIQHFFIAHRSFDLSDIAADAVGCVLGFLFVKKYQSKTE